MTDLIARVKNLVRRPPVGDEESELVPNGDRLIHHFDVMCSATCPCGSQILHNLTLVSTVDCPRCGRTIGIRSIEYFRRGPGQVPEPRITIGYIFTDRALLRRKTSGVH